MIFKGTHGAFVIGTAVNRIISIYPALDGWRAGFADKHGYRCSGIRGISLPRS
jgi:hypothetical protein